MEESIALTATANEVIQNPEIVGQALKTISMRIRGVVADDDEDGETVMEPAKLGQIIQDITKKYTDDGQGISILASPDKFKSTYQILLELSEVWGELTDTESAYLLEKIAGKHRATVLQSILTNEKTLVESYESALNSAGSAMTEFEKRTESVEYHLNQLSAAWQELSTNAASVELVNNIIDTGRYIVEFVNKIGAMTASFGVIGGALGTFTAVSIFPALDAKFEQVKMEADSAGKKIKTFRGEIDVTSQTVGKFDKKIVGLTKMFGGLKNILVGGLIGSVALATITIAIDKFSEFYDKAKHEVSNLTGEIDSLTASITSMKSEIESLNSGGIATEGDLQRIRVLEKQIELEERALELKTKQKAEAIIKNADAYFSGNSQGIISSEFEDAMSAAEKASEAYKENIEFLEQNADAVKNADEKLKLYSTSFIKYGGLSSELNALVYDYNNAQEKTAELYDEASKKLQDLYQHQDTLNWAIENGTDAQIEAAKVQKTNLDLFIYEQELLLGIADSYENASKKVEKYNTKHSVLSSVVEEANKTNKVSEESFEKLKQEYPEVAEEVEKYADKTNEAYLLEKKAVDSLNSVLIESRKIQLEAQYDMTQAAIYESNQRIKQYQEEASSVLKILEATLFVSEEMANNQLTSISPLLLETEDMSVDGPYAYQGSGRTYYDIVKKNLSEEEKALLDAIKSEKDSIKKSQQELKELQSEIDKLGSGKSGSTESKKLGDTTSAADIFDKYANALANAREEIERYGAAVELAQAQLDLNQSQEERSVELLGEEQELYGKLLEAQQARYKIVNDTLWLQQQQLKAVKEEASQKVSAKLGTDVDVSNWTQADVEEFVYNLKVDTSEADADLANFLNAMIEMQGDVDSLYVDWYNMKKEIRETELEQLQKVIDFQNDSLEQFDDARKQTEKILSLLEEVEDTEDERLNIVKNLSDSYEGQKETIMAMHQANVAQMHELAQDMERNQQAYNRLVEQNQKLEEDYLDVIQAQLNYKQQQIDLEQELAEKRAESEIYGDKGKDKWEDARQDEIDALNDQIDELNKKAEEDDFAEQMAEYEKDIAEKEQEIADLYKKLDNLRSQKTVQTLEQQADGSFQWKYVEDQIAINETLEEIADKEVEIEELKNEKKEAEEERALEEEIAHLEAQIEAIEDEVERRQQLFDEELQVIEDTYQKEKAKLAQWLQDEITHWQTRVAENEIGLTNYDAMNTACWNMINTNTDTALTDLEGTYDLHFQNIVDTIGRHAATAIAHINAIAAAQRRAAEAAREAAAARASADSADGSHAMGLRFVEANNYVARLHYGERVLTRQEAQQYNELEDDIKSGHLKAYFDSMKQETADRISTDISTSVARIGSSVPMAGNNSSTSFVIEHLELPNVQDAQDFANVLQRWAKQEFGGLAQKAKIVKAR